MAHHRRDLGPKRRLYARHGVEHYWTVDPDARALTEHVLQEGELVEVATHHGEVKISPRAFPKLRLELGRVWG